MTGHDPATQPGLLGGRVLRLGATDISVRVHGRVAVVTAALLAAALAITVVSVGSGQYPLSPGQVIATLLGHGTPVQAFVVQTLRLPRALCALLVGAALGLSGAILQSVVRNPLGSPDIVGFTQGAATAAVIEIVLLGGSTFAIAAGSVVGGLVTALLVYALAYRGGAEGYRLVLVGIALSAMLAALRSYLIARANLDVAQEAQVWLTGSLDGLGWEHVRPLAIALALLVPLAVALRPRLALLELGDEAATGLGVSVQRTRLELVLLAVALAAVATAAAGPIAFVALAAPQLARRLTGAPGPGLLAAGVMGAVLLAVADYASQRVLGATELPVGVLTGAIGGLYLIWLLQSEWRRERRR